MDVSTVRRDRITATHAGTAAAAAGESLRVLVELVARLRGPHGCVWDAAQSATTLAPYVLEELHELLEAIESGVHDDIREELGDMTYHIVMLAQLSEEADQKGLCDVLDGIAAKLRRRHPALNVDADGQPPVEPQLQPAEREAAVETSWSARKQAEGRALLSGVPRRMPALARAVAISRRAASVGFDWEQPFDVLAKLREELDELIEACAEADARADAAARAHIAEELGDLLFAAANLARRVELDPEQALHAATRKFERRFGYIEAQVRKRAEGFTGMTLDELEFLWQEAKHAERGDAPGEGTDRQPPSSRPGAAHAPSSGTTHTDAHTDDA